MIVFLVRIVIVNVLKRIAVSLRLTVAVVVTIVAEEEEVRNVVKVMGIIAEIAIVIVQEEAVMMME